MGGTLGPQALALLWSISGVLLADTALGEPDAFRREKNHRSAYPLRQHLLDAGSEACTVIDKDSYVTGLLFNGPGLHTYYQQAYCFLELAVRERAPELCRQVRERRSLFFDGSGVGKAVCEARVAAAIEDDRKEARHLVEARGRVLASAEVVGIVEYDAVTSASSLILRASFKPLSWPYYRYEFEFVDARGQVLARLYESPHGVDAADRLFLLPLVTLEQALAGVGLDSIGAIVLRVPLVNSVESALVMAHLDFKQLDEKKIADSAFKRIPILGAIEHRQWTGLVSDRSRDADGFLASLEQLLGREN